MNTQNLTIEEQEAAAYAAGDTATAALLGRIIELESANKALEQELDILRDEIYTASFEQAYGGSD
jgi:hypothetical protein